MLTHVTLWDDGPRCEAFVPARRWNGFLTPVLTMAGVDALIAWLRTQGSEVTLTAESLTVVGEDAEPEVFAVEVHACLGGARGIDFGGGWVWTFVDDEEEG